MSTLAADLPAAGPGARSDRACARCRVRRACLPADDLDDAALLFILALDDRQRRVAPVGVFHLCPHAGVAEIELGRHVGLSRSALHERFSQLLGQAPMQYLSAWRMQVASGLLRDSNAPVAAIAAEVGYDSEAAFSRAFKRLVGAPPAAWRRRLAMPAQGSGTPEQASGRERMAV